jgi:signal transduction histidine kinase
MAEIATNVLHNVGNVLNSVNVSASLVSDRLRSSKVKGLARAVRLLDEHAGDLGDFITRDAKGKLIPGYLRDLAQTLEQEQEAMAWELSTLSKSVDHIKEVVATQQSYAGTPRFLESVILAELVDDALRMNSGALTRHKVDVVKNLAELPALPLDRHRLLQILVNLISNAKHAMSGVDGQDVHNACITLGAHLADVANGHVLHITVADNGEGIAPENLTRIFSHGFTTRKNGHGFGLHSCVLAAQEMGGSLSAHSDGSGRGASFTLEIPIDIPESQR